MTTRRFDWVHDRDGGFVILLGPESGLIGATILGRHPDANKAQELARLLNELDEVPLGGTEVRGRLAPPRPAFGADESPTYRQQMRDAGRGGLLR